MDHNEGYEYLCEVLSMSPSRNETIPYHQPENYKELVAHHAFVYTS